MSDTIAVNPSPTSKADVYRVWTTNSVFDIGTLVLGSTAKANQNQGIWMLFEPNIPAGATFTGVTLDLYQETLSLTSTVNIRVGFLAGDGTWEAQASSLGWDEYAGAYNTMPEPDRTGTSDAGWINNFASFDPFVSTSGTAPASATAFSFADSGGTYNDAQFLTDAQDAFDAEEASRTARGVPMAILMIVETNAAQQWVLKSNEHASGTDLPTLTIVYDPPPIASELSSTSSIDADLIGDFTLATELSSTTAVDADVDMTYGAATELSAQATLDAAGAVAVSAATELSAAASVDADLDVFLAVASELSSTTTVDADVDVTYGAASELAAQATLDAGVGVIYGAASELSSTSALDAAPLGLKTPAAELSTSTTLDAAGEVTALASAELIAQASLDAETDVTRFAASELAGAATLDARLIGVFNVATELVGAATLDAAVRPSETALNPLEVLYMAENIEVRYTADTIEVTAPATNIEVTKPAENVEVGAE